MNESQPFCALERMPSIHYSIVFNKNVENYSNFNNEFSAQFWNMF
jgi:hypothetical protein